MKKQHLSWVAIVSMGLIAFTLLALAAAGDLAAAPVGLPPVVSGGLYTHHRDDGLINVATLSLFGPNGCTAHGDPYSPLNSIWTAGPYTYTYQIRIPADYPADIIRVELFDPDTSNNDLMSAMVTHTDTAVNLGMPITETLNCNAFNGQKEICVIDTGEITTTAMSYDQVNARWLVRVDENRGMGLADGDGTCGAPSTYTPRYNSQTSIRLYYQQDNGGSPQRVDLAAYTGQVNDGVRDSGSHDTDLRWVSPGAPSSYDQPTTVPTDCGSPNGGDFDAVSCPGGTAVAAGSGFEVSISQDLTNIVVDPVSGERFLYLDVTAVDGASENGFDIWAGPPDSVNSIASDANVRNVQILNAPGVHDSAGVTVLTSDYLPQNFLVDFLVNKPLAYLGPEYAGQTINVTLFDSDTGALPPITFTLDSMAAGDWAMTFGVPGLDDPDGVAAGVRCLPGSCNNLWITPTYTITLPGDMSGCDWLNPTPADCTPFYGGRFAGSYYGSPWANDTFGWQITVPPPPAVDPLQGCTAFPVAVYDDIRSVTPTGGSDPYPDAADFTYPAAPPAYGDFFGHTPDVSLALAKEGDVFKLVGPGFDAGNYGWLLWNEGRPSTAATLAASLTWPGDSSDYADHGDPGTPLGSFGHVVRGYVNPTNTNDITLNLINPVLASGGDLSSTAVQTAVNDHVDANRALRLPLWDTASAVTGQYQMSGFAIFRVAGYGTTAGEGDWLLLEFVRHETTCGQQLPTSVRLQELSMSDSAAPSHLVLIAGVLLVTAVSLTAYQRNSSKKT